MELVEEKICNLKVLMLAGFERMETGLVEIREEVVDLKGDVTDLKRDASSTKQDMEELARMTAEGFLESKQNLDKLRKELTIKVTKGVKRS